MNEKHYRTKCAHFMALAIFASYLVMSQTGYGQCDSSWDGGGAGDNWSNADNWDPDTTPGTSDDVCHDATSDEIDYDPTSGTVASFTVVGNATRSLRVLTQKVLSITGNLLNSDTDAEDYYVVTIESRGNMTVGGDSTRVRYDVKAGTAMDPTELTISGDLNMLGTTPTDSEQLIDVRSDSLLSVGGNVVNGRFDIRGSNTTVDIDGSIMGPDGLVWGLSSVTATVDGDVSEGAALNGKGLVIFSGSTDATIGTSAFIDGETITPTVESTESTALKLWLLDSSDVSTATSVVEGGSDNLVVAIAGNSSIFRAGTEISPSSSSPTIDGGTWGFKYPDNTCVTRAFGDIAKWRNELLTRAS